MNNLQWFIKKTPIGSLRVEFSERDIVACRWIKDHPITLTDKNFLSGKIIKIAIGIEKEIDAYFQGKLTSFSIPVNPSGTEFEMKVWKELLKIPYGCTATYREIAERIGDPKSVRAVGMACKKNPIGLFIPCHRVVGSGGTWGGYNGGIEKKLFLLEMECNASGLFLYPND